MSKKIKYSCIVLLLAVILLSVLYGREINSRVKRASQIDDVVYDIISDARKSFVAFQTTGDTRSFERGVSGLYALYKIYPIASKYENSNYIILHEMMALLGTNTNYAAVKSEYTDRLIEALEELETDYNSAPGYTKLEYLLIEPD